MLSASCCGFSHVNDGGGGGDADMAGLPTDGDMGGGGTGGGGGGGTGGGGGGGGTASCTNGGCGCGAPVLIVAVQSVNGATGNDGKVMQLTVPASGPATACGPTLAAAGALSKSPTAVGWVAPDSVLYGSTESVLLLDAIHDRIRTTYRPTQFGDIPRALFMLARTGDTDVIAVGYDTNGYNDVTALALVDPKDGAQLKWWDLTSSTSPILLGSSVPSMAHDPFDATKIAFVQNGGTAHPVMETAVPWDGMTVIPTTWYATRPPGSQPTTLNTLDGAVKRAVWAQTTTSTTTADVIYENRRRRHRPAALRPAHLRDGHAVQAAVQDLRRGARSVASASRARHLRHRDVEPAQRRAHRHQRMHAPRRWLEAPGADLPRSARRR